MVSVEKQRTERWLVFYRETDVGRRLWAAHRTSNRDAIEYLSAELSLLRWQEAYYREVLAHLASKAPARQPAS